MDMVCRCRILCIPIARILFFIAYPFGCKVQPGACGMVPEIISAELSRVSDRLCLYRIYFCIQPFAVEQNLLGSIYQHSKWQDCDVTIKRSAHTNKKNNCYYTYTNKHLFKEVDVLRFVQRRLDVFLPYINILQ